MARYSTLNRIARIAEDQWGLITRRQAEGAGVSQATLQRLATTGILDRVAHGVYRLTGAPPPDHLDLRAAWLQLAAEVPAWERTPQQGVVSHRSAAALYGLGHLPPDRHEFTLPERRQSRRPDVRLHHRTVRPDEWIVLHGMPVTRPSRIAADLLDDKEDPEAVSPGAFRRALTDKLRVLAAGSRWTLQQLQRQMAYDRLLERLYLVDEGWIIKGATALLARDIGVRGTIDIDLYRDVAGEISEADLRQAAALDIGDWFRFEIGPPRPLADTSGVRLPVKALVGNTEWSAFHADLVGEDIRMTGDPEGVPPLARVVMPDLDIHGLMLELIAAERPDTVGGVPTMLIAMLDHPGFAATDLSSIRQLLTGGAVVPPALVGRVEAAFGAPLSIVAHALGPDPRRRASRPVTAAILVSAIAASTATPAPKVSL